MTTGEQPRVEVDPDSGAVVLRGELTYMTVPDLHTVLSDGTAGDPDLVLDVTALTFCDSAGLAAFLGASRRAERRGGRVTLAGARPRLRRMLQLTGVESLFSYDGTDRREDGPTREGRSETA
jgi:anti-sigma B factor antagonist